MTRYTMTLQREAGEAESFLLDAPTGVLRFYAIAVKADALWTPADGDTVTIERLDDPEEAVQAA